jgi:hypothetical protein
MAIMIWRHKYRVFHWWVSISELPVGRNFWMMHPSTNITISVDISRMINDTDQAIMVAFDRTPPLAMTDPSFIRHSLPTGDAIAGIHGRPSSLGVAYYVGRPEGTASWTESPLIAVTGSIA